MRPALSVVLPAMEGYRSVAAALQSWEAQTCRDRLEILVLCPGAEAPAAPGHTIVPIGSANLHEARAIGVQRASADYVTFAEDHCLPDPDWAEAILQRIEEGWDAITPALRPGDVSCWGQASFLAGYAEWMMPVAGGPTQVVSGSNLTVRVSLLRALGAELARELLVGAFLAARLRAQGARLYLEDRARMRHFNPPGWSTEMALFAGVGLGFGSVRARRWPFAARLAYPLAAPAIAFLHWRRAHLNYRRAGRASGIRPAALAAALALCCAWGLGEAAGAWMPCGRAARYLWREEIKPVSPEDAARSDARERVARSGAEGPC
jgi:hypothetical protein